VVDQNSPDGDLDEVAASNHSPAPRSFRPLPSTSKRAACDPFARGDVGGLRLWHFQSQNDG